MICALSIHPLGVVLRLQNPDPRNTGLCTEACVVAESFERLAGPYGSEVGRGESKAFPERDRSALVRVRDKILELSDFFFL